MSGQFEIYKDGDGKYRFRFKNDRGDILLKGEAYETKESCRSGIESVQKNAGKLPIVEMGGESE